MFHAQLPKEKRPTPHIFSFRISLTVPALLVLTGMLRAEGVGRKDRVDLPEQVTRPLTEKQVPAALEEAIKSNDVLLIDRIAQRSTNKAAVKKAGEYLKNHVIDLDTAAKATGKMTADDITGLFAAAAWHNYRRYELLAQSGAAMPSDDTIRYNLSAAQSQMRRAQQFTAQAKVDRDKAAAYAGYLLAITKAGETEETPPGYEEAVAKARTYAHVIETIWPRWNMAKRLGKGIEW